MLRRCEFCVQLSLMPLFFHFFLYILYFGNCLNFPFSEGFVFVDFDFDAFFASSAI